MLIFDRIEPLQNFLKDMGHKTVGFVPTMGALHKGHLSLIEQSKKQCDVTVCSIFVNPIQFNKKEDLEKYPKNLARDIELLKQVNCDVLFCPSVEEMYPQEINKHYEFGDLEKVMEGKHRPGHFNGVAIVIERFFEIIKPDYAFFGEKDFQQLVVVKTLVKQLGLSLKIVGCATVREANGLAMSSRNERLSEQQKAAAAQISKMLSYISHHKKDHTVSELKEYFKTNIAKNAMLSTEYFEIADGNTLKPIQNWKESDYCIAFCAVNVDKVRLIDNMTIIN